MPTIFKLKLMLEKFLEQLKYPKNFITLHYEEETLHSRSIKLASVDKKLLLHLNMIENTMDILDVSRQTLLDDEDFKVIQMLCMRMFNAFASSLKLTFSGYYQNAALILRDVLETVFLLDLFRIDKSAIERWRCAERQLDEFRPVNVRKFLDRHYGHTENKRANAYKMFSELAGHPNIKSVSMLCPKGMDARNGPFLDPSALKATLDEMGRLAVQIGETVDIFLKENDIKFQPTQTDFYQCKGAWILQFYGHTIENGNKDT